MLTARCGDIVLRPATEADDDALVALLPDDFDHDPTFAPLPGEVLTDLRARWLRHWLATLRTPAAMSDRTIPFVVEVEGRIVGLQTLEGEQFTRNRVVDSSSFLVPQMRRRGLGVAMRTAMLAVAFERMGAVKAISAARPGNIASHRVSARVGYRATGRTHDVIAGSPRPLDHYVLTREEWARLDHLPVAVDGLLPWDEVRERIHALAAHPAMAQCPHDGSAGTH